MFVFTVEWNSQPFQASLPVTQHWSRHDWNWGVSVLLEHTQTAQRLLFWEFSTWPCHPGGFLFQFCWLVVFSTTTLTHMNTSLSLSSQSSYGCSPVSEVQRPPRCQRLPLKTTEKMIPITVCYISTPSVWAQKKGNSSKSGKQEAEGSTGVKSGWSASQLMSLWISAFIPLCSLQSWSW